MAIFKIMVLRDTMVYDSENWSADQLFSVVSLGPSFTGAVISVTKVYKLEFCLFVCLLNRLATNVDVPCCSNRVVERFSFCRQFSRSTLPHVFYCPFGGFSFDSSVARPHGHLESIHVQGFISGEIL